MLTWGGGGGGGGGSLHDFKFGTSTGRFPSEGAAAMAVKGLTPSWLLRGSGRDRCLRR